MVRDVRERGSVMDERHQLGASVGSCSVDLLIALLQQTTHSPSHTEGPEDHMTHHMTKV